ncbi:hypothetical protein [Streptomyces echinatus]|uniref:hypothetical protein n=1 Tax=Streptomyces echinatus TaxID=67293 RepID=UPI0037B8E68D
METLKDLIERVLGENDQLPRDDQELTLLIAGLRQHLPRLEQIVKGKDRDLAENVRHLREAPLPVGRMPLVIRTIQLAEMAQALIDRLDAQALGDRAAARDNSGAGRHTVALQDVLAIPSGDDRQVIGAATVLLPRPEATHIRALQYRAAGQETSALAGSLQDCGPPAA